MAGARPGLSEVAGLVRCWRPDRDVRSLAYLGAGDFCHAYLLNGAEVVRVPRHEAADRALEKEACLMPGLAPRLPVAVPVPTYVRCRDGRASFAVHDRISGTELTVTLWRGLPEPARAELARGVGRFLQSLHGLDRESGHACGVEVIDHRARARRLRRELRDEGGSRLPPSLREELDGSLARYLSSGEAWRYDATLLHADVGPGHVLVDVERAEVTGVIDWGDVAIGDPARDFIFLYEDWGSEFLALALEGYGLETTARLRPRVQLQYLIDQLDWTLRAAVQGRRREVEHGIGALRQGVRDLRGSAGDAFGGEAT